MGLRMPELLIIVLILLLLFGAKRLPQLGVGIGSGIRSLKRALNGDGADESAASPVPPATPDPHR